MADQKPCSKLQSFFMTEGQRLIKARMRARSGEKVEAQIANAAIDLGLPYITCWRAYQGRCGERAFQKIYAADQDLRVREQQTDKAGEIIARLEALEQTLAELRDTLEVVARQEPDHARRDDRRLGVAHATA